MNLFSEFVWFIWNDMGSSSQSRQKRSNNARLPVLPFALVNASWLLLIIRRNGWQLKYPLRLATPVGTFFHEPTRHTGWIEP